jgi:autotransporter-associated beta strand protein
MKKLQKKNISANQNFAPKIIALLISAYAANISAQSTTTVTVPFQVDMQYLNQPALNTINTLPAYNLGLSGKGVKIGQLDTGTSPNHVAFAGAIANGMNVSTGQVGTSASIIFDSGAPYDHGSVVGSIMLGRRNGLDLKGNMQGLAYNSQLVIGSSFTFLAYNTVNATTYQQANDQLLANGINFVASQGVKVINNSYGFYNDYKTLQNNIPLALQAYADASKKAVIVFAAGNNALANNPNLPTPYNLVALPTALPYYMPSANNGTWIVAVATTVDGQNMARGVGTAYPNYPTLTPSNPAATYSNYCGVTASYCVSAPGGYALQGGGGTNYNENITVLINGGALVDNGLTGAWGETTNQFYSPVYFAGAYNGQGATGTSFASALTSATVALVAEKYPWMTPAQLATTVLTTASHASQISEIDGRGMINVGKAVLGPAIFETTFNADTQGYSSVFGNDISGAAGLNKTGAGSLTLTGVETYRGDTSVSGGTLAFEGTGPSNGNVSVNSGGVLQVGTSLENSTASLGGNVTVNSGGSLYGYGTVTSQNKTLVNNGLVAVSPSSGAALGTLNVAGNYVQTNNGLLALRVGNNAQSDSLKVAGASVLAGSVAVYASSPITMAAKYKLVSSGSSSGTFATMNTNLANYTSMNYYLSYGNNGVTLVLPPSAVNTLSSIQNNANLLTNTFAAQAATQFAGLNYDCSVFSSNGICVSAGGRSTQVKGTYQGYNTGGGLIIGGYRLSPSLRVGAWLDEGFPAQGNNIQTSNSNPTVGLSSVYAPSGNDSGTQVMASLSYFTNSTTATRQQLLNTEPGSGTSTLKSLAARIQVGYGFDNLVTNVLMTPFVGVRYYNASLNGYTENGSFPISYNSTTAGNNSALAGLKVSGKIDEHYSAMFTVGVESDLSKTNVVYSGNTASVPGMSSFSTQPSNSTSTTRPYANVGFYYTPDKASVIGLTSYYQQSYYQSVSSITTMLTYTVGL